MKTLEANKGLAIALDDRKGNIWKVDTMSGNPRRSLPGTYEREIQMSAPCDARRGQIQEDYVYGQPVDDDYRIALLDSDLYFPDGQIRGEDYVAAQELNADRPEAHLNLASLYVRERKFESAEAEFRTALSLDPSFPPAAVNLADLYRELGRESEGEGVLRAALKRSPADASLLHALGPSMVRQKKRAKALELFAAASHIDPANPRYSCVYAVALNESGQTNAQSQRSSALSRHILTTGICSPPWQVYALGSATVLRHCCKRAA